MRELTSEWLRTAGAWILEKRLIGIGITAVRETYKNFQHKNEITM